MSRFSAVVWLALCSAIGLGLGFLSLEVVGLLLLPLVAVALIHVARRQRRATASLVALVAGYEMAVAAFAGLDLVESRDPAVNFGDPLGLIVYVLVIAGMGLAVLAVGLRVARRHDWP